MLVPPSFLLVPPSFLAELVPPSFLAEIVMGNGETDNRRAVNQQVDLLRTSRLDSWVCRRG
jgi:hypothetical protein